MTLTLAIPARDDTGHLCRLLARAGALGLAERVVVVDDGSDPAIDGAALQAAAGLGPGRLTLLRNDRPRGPGIARNQALDHAATDHLLFLDADDLPTRELPELLRDLDGERFDFCLFQHHDTRMEQERIWGQTAHDQALWRAAGVDLGALTPVSGAAAGTLSRTANYPWNKIYRTGFLREHGIGCSDLLVHEDIELHWRSFLNAGRILASDRVGVIHFVAPDGDRLTNRTGPERLAVFDPLARIAEEILATAPDIYALPFFGFAFGLFGWIAGNLDPAHHAAFAERIRDFVTAHVPPVWLDRLRQAEPRKIEPILARAGLTAP